MSYSWKIGGMGGAPVGGAGHRAGSAEDAFAFERDVLKLITRGMPMPELLAELCRHAERLLGDGAICSILLLDADGQHIRLGSAPSLPDYYRRNVDGTPVGPHSTPSGTAIYENRTVAVEDLLADPAWAAFAHGAAKSGVCACWTTPLENDAGGVMGALAVYRGVPWRPDAATERLLREIGLSVAALVNQANIAQRLAESEEHYRLVVDHLNEGIVVQSRDNTILACNRSARRILRLPDDVIGQSILTVIPRVLDEDGQPMSLPRRPSMLAQSAGKSIIGRTTGLELANGEIVWVSENVLPIFRPGETEASSVVVSFTDIGAVREAQQQLLYLATRDPLTGLYNRTWLADRMRELLESEDGTTCPALLFVDLDGFKKVNDTGGHEAGDTLLRAVAARLTQCVRDAGTLARVGGDEFVIAVRRHEGGSELIALAQQVLDAIAVPFKVADNEYYLGASIGISRYPDDGTDAAALMRNADSAMYVAKQRGTNQFQFFTAELRQRLERRYLLEQLLRRALASGELRLVYQPIVDGKTGSTIGAEALLRWESGELGPVRPAEFIPIAEDTGMIIGIGQWVLEHACRQAAQWRRLIAPDFVMAVNLSPRQFTEGLVEQIERCLTQAGLDPSGLELEITEGLLMNDSQSVLPMLRAISDLGVRISVDDFGTGYSSLSYLKRFPLHHLKVDRSFVMGLPDNRDSAAITQAVVAMAHSLGMHVTAEGVETPEQSSFLKSLGCERQQGYLFGRPVAASVYASKLSGA
ncbi:bifunctional diguanylate cyclase/phosphodiesterase [Paraburkholderia adhaesiva]|uniref:bifunctional diguanylate cyclase/phosphodiesterase n=1 Tax=Paraburkholderia adhaesiva TaxID=2883244 RepID=UPI0035711234